MEENFLDHASRAHALISMSGLERTVNCPISVVLSKDIPDDERSSASIEGTYAHEVSELYLEAKLTDKPYPEIHDSKYDEEMKRCGDGYALFAYKTVEPYLQYPHYWAIERKLVANKELDIWGTSDFVFVYVKDSKKHVISIDFKYGMKPVKAVNNWQLAGYAYGAAVEFTKKPEDYKKLGTFTGIIYQPRIQKDLETYVPEQWTVSYKFLFEEMISVIEANAKLIHYWITRGTLLEEDYKKYQRAGDHCYFCKAKGICKTYKDKHSGPILELFDVALQRIAFETKKKKFTPENVQGSGVLTLDDIAYIAQNEKMLISFIESVSNIAYKMALEGEQIPGMKVVEATQRRSYIDDMNACASILKQRGIPQPITYEPKLISMTEAEKILGKGKIDDILRFPKEKSYKLVPETEKGEAIEIDKSQTVSLFDKYITN